MSSLLFVQYSSSKCLAVLALDLISSNPVNHIVCPSCQAKASLKVRMSKCEVAKQLRSTMKAVKASLLLLLSNYLSGCTSSSFIRRSSGSSSGLTSFKSSSYPKGGLLRDGNFFDAHDVLKNIRGGQQSSDGSTGSYHGNYVAQAGGGEPKAAAVMPTSAATASTASTATTIVSSPPAPSPPVLASATSTNSKLSNLQERTGPAVLMLGAVYLLLKFTGSKGLIGLVFAMQIALYYEGTSVVEDFGNKNKGGVVEDVASFPLQKWWWFATAMMFTSGR